MKQIYTILFTATLLICQLLTSTPAFSTDKGDTFTLAIPKEGWPPYIITDTNEPCGIMLDIINEVANCTGKKLHIEYYPEIRSQLMLAEGRVHIQPKAREWVDKPSRFQWTDPVIDSTDVLIFRKEEAHLDNKPLKDLSVGVILGYRYPTLEPLFEQGELRRYNVNNTDNLLHMLHHGHIQAAVTNRHVAEWIIMQSPDISIDQFVFGKAVDSVPYRFALTKAKPMDDFMSLFNKELSAMKEDGRLQEIMNRYH
ncbi:transporter substrate-binding domain-containing protein [Pseudodesulfovibrio sp. zrk46]|uniref:substrate-binding periplasmic protein n=1 Tax=Pseudodesulfovibrio sp. zrk46 TaxID=2725288 RepID=UPI001449F6BB|nr:transporter substrate-binding domain-containing protein [Pseudodesulfovibrio sp. zrk46]QJB55056.1 amino acid ABC transporter substrate-binding protein [Pseudodesulfovibrio sp. zrk46]